MSFRIGAWTFEDEAHVLANGPSELKLEPRAAAVLELLARRPNEVVSKDALITSVWKGQVVSEHSVAVVISDLRRAFGDDPRAPEYIETIPKRGYRLIAPVVAEASTHRLGVWLAALVTGFVALAGLAWFTVQQTSFSTLIVTDIGNATGDSDATYVAHAFSETIPIELLETLENEVVRWRTPALEAPDGSLVLTGRIISNGSGRSLSMQLSDPRSRTVSWGASFDLDGADFAEISHRLSRQVAQALGAEPATPAVASPVPAELHELYWRARYLWSLREHEAIREAITLLTRAVELDPEFARAHVALADIYAHKTAEELDLDRVDTFEEAVRHLERARAIDSALPEIAVTEALLAFYRDRDARTAMTPIRRAVHANPRNAASWQTLGMIASARGHHTEALSAIDRARALDPLSASILWDRVWFLYVAGDARAASEAAEAARRVTAPVHVFEALIYEAMGDDERALHSWIARARQRGLPESELSELRALVEAKAFDDAYEALATKAGVSFREADVPLAALELRAGARENAIERLAQTRPGPQSWWWHWVHEMPAFAELQQARS